MWMNVLCRLLERQWFDIYKITRNSSPLSKQYIQVPSKSVSQQRLPMLFAVELASISCDLVDLDSFQSTLSVQFFSITKVGDILSFVPMSTWP